MAYYEFNGQPPHALSSHLDLVPVFLPLPAQWSLSVSSHLSPRLTGLAKPEAPLLAFQPYIHASLSSLTLTAARMATPASAPDTRALVADFVGYKLRQKGYVCGAGPGEGPAADPLHQAMRAAGDEFETRFRRTFSDLAAQLHVTPGSAQQRFTQVSDELFQGGPNWGRLVAFFVFGAALCAESVNKEMEPLVGQVQEWMVAYLETRLADWIHSSGGWVRSFSVAALHTPLQSWSPEGRWGSGLRLGAESPYLGGTRCPHYGCHAGLCTPGLPGSHHWMGSWSIAEDRVHSACREMASSCWGLFTPKYVTWVGGRGCQAWVVVKKALAKDASSEQKFRPGRGWHSLEAERANEPGAHGG